ncbi:hypothetical protein A0H81_03146 [Grifola frondosa]|uniref:Uncharacterized protein n=1 Tax=Grifola frondosa TaxID=5627 RepID=A0A1C7MJE1_GRIFR|nr:hypothetical protein A0H81_03146 [Grifola frondosa]
MANICEFLLSAQAPLQGFIVKGGIRLHPRDIYVDVSAVLTSTFDWNFVYADVLVWPSTSRTSVILPDGGAISLFARQFTSDTPVTLEISARSQDEAKLIVYASFLDQPISFTTPTATTITPLDLGADSLHVGAVITVANGSASVEYLTHYDVQDLDGDSQLSKLLTTQLRIASILFWLSPSLAANITTHVISATSESSACALLNMQANALAHQLSVSAIGGPSLSYAPVLTLDTYQTSLDGAIDAVAAFQTQYDRFSDRKTSLVDQKQAWGTMAAHAEDAVRMQTQMVEDAKAKWVSAGDILNAAEVGLREHQITIKEKQMYFKLGVEAWKQKKMLLAVVDILLAAVTFAISIGAICIGDPAPAAAAPAEAAGAIKTVEEAAEAASGVTKLIQLMTMKTLKEVSEELDKLYEATRKNVDTLNGIAVDLDAGMSPFPKVESGNAELESIVGIAAWDKWVLEMDDQMEFAVSEDIGGASDYRLELRKQAIDGKMVAQARAQAVKAGQEYIQLQLALQLAKADLTRLKVLQETYEGEKEQLAEAEARFYDRLDLMRTSVLIEMRNAVWAYKYYTLRQSAVQLDPLKSAEEYRADKQMLVQELEGYLGTYSSDKSPFSYQRDSNQLSLGPTFITSLQTTGKTTFSLLPPSAAQTSSSGPFTHGTNFRVRGMRAFLLGAVPKSGAFSPDGTALISLTILTSGVYTDVREDGSLWSFTSMPLRRPFQYRVGSDTKAREERVEIDSLFESKYHMDPTPFTQWTIEINNLETLDLSALNGVRLEWEGSAYFE